MQAQQSALERLMRMPTAASPSASVATTPRYSPSPAAFLAEASKRFAGTLDLESIAHAMADLCVQRLGDASVVCTVRDGHAVGLVVAAHRDPCLRDALAGFERQAADAANWRPVLSVAHSQKPAVLSHVTATLLADTIAAPGTAARLGLKAGLMVPVTSKTRTLAVVVLLSEHARFYSRARLALADELASRFGQALEIIETLRQYQTLHVRGDDERAEALAAAVHDLMSPLSVIKATAQVLHRLEARTDASIGDELRRRLDGIDSATGRMNAELRQMLDSLRPRPRPAAEPDHMATDLVAVVERVIDEQQSINDDHAITLLEAPAGLIGPWDPDDLDRMLCNLIGNAVKYSPARSAIHVHVRGEEDPDGHWAVLQVRDQGCGIPAHDLPFVFEPFQRGSNVGEVTGSGLGLASVWQTVKLHDGRLWVESEEGKGTRVTVRLPLTPSATSTPLTPCATSIPY